MNGLANLVADTGTLHSIEGPPVWEDGRWAARRDYERAYSEWWFRVHCWHGEKTQP